MSVLDQLMKELSAIEKSRKPGPAYKQSPVGPYMHGPNGLFSQPGLSRDVISTRLHPFGLADLLPVSGTIDMDPLYAYITGFQNTTGTVADGVCDEPETAGPIKNCIQTAQFGRYSFQTRELELNKVGQRTNRGEFLDLRLVNDPLLADTNSITTPNVPGNADLMREVLVRFIEVGVSFQNQLTRQLYIGNPANNSGGGGYAEFPGLDILIGTNKVDAITGQHCPSLNSDIKDFNYAKIGQGTDTDIVNVLTYLARQVRYTARHSRMEPTQWVFAMRPELFYELTAVWPCAYLTYRCGLDGTSANRNNVDAADAVAFRDDMRENNYLRIDGINYPVVQDAAILEESSTDTALVDEGCFASDIYLIPTTVRGGMATTYWEHLDYSRGTMVGAQDGRLAETFFWTDDGRFLWHAEPPNRWCVKWLAKIEPRVKLITPHLAGRVTNVQYCPLQHVREPFPNDPYFVNGGVTARESATFFSDWNQPG